MARNQLSTSLIIQNRRVKKIRRKKFATNQIAQ